MTTPDTHAKLLCQCDKPALFVAPGTEPVRFTDKFTVSRGEAVRVWCLECWPWRRPDKPA